MEKITKRQQAAKLAVKMAQNSEIELQLFDNADANEIFHLEDSDNIHCTMVWYDTVNGTAGRARYYISEITEQIWNHRKFINRSGRLERL